MATGSKVHLEALQKPQFYVQGLKAESAEKASQLLQVNHEKHHIFFNQSGFHNHIAHHLLTLFALNASPEELQKAYDANVSYQRPSEPLEKAIVSDMHEPERFKSYLGQEKYYHDFLVYFQQEIDKSGWQRVLQEHLFAETELADDMLARMFAGFLHPIIHLGFGIEFQQPAIIAEALAQAAVHDNWIASLFFGCEKAAKESRSKDGPRKTIVQILEECKKDDKLSKAAHWDDGNKVRDGIIKRAPEEMIKYATQYTVKEEELEEKTAEMINAVEWKIWMDIAMYVSRGCPTLLVDEITGYAPTKDSGMDEVIKRVNDVEDDGHACKLVRAIANAEAVCKKWEGREGMLVQGDMWRKLGHMAVDSVEAGEPHWVRSCGFAEAWEKIPLRDGAKL
ncbi:uncharacterized protein J4E88_004718 [Alternaria novae-zelandiae]|uniref:uncharacterized protein n=1 Tax=Alternaria novae-zelandiae TaxID=430562 RepID=UPI0020C290EF|nr:uncharacterized protein J4E88_004718 [Alternaria novae-zelandiae]KAI4683542.1 hypothetical protein J4E88_004718 [Alternaria novae-zelandiae]